MDSQVVVQAYGMFGQNNLHSLSQPPETLLKPILRKV